MASVSAGRKTHVTTVRWARHHHALIAAAAEDAGVPVAAFVREAALVRWAFQTLGSLPPEQLAQVSEQHQAMLKMASEMVVMAPPDAG